jgi:hypothetical protein
MRENLIWKVFLGLFIALVMYGTYNESMKQYELYQHNSNLLKSGTIIYTDVFWRGDTGYDLYYNYLDVEHGDKHMYTTYNLNATQLSEIMKQDSIKIIYMKDVDRYYAKYYDQVLKEMKLWHIIIQSLSYIIIALSVWIPLKILNEIRYRRLRDKLQLLRQINAKLERGEELQ